MINYWLIFGIVLIILEVVIPGMVVSFVGLAALTVALLLYLQVIEALHIQILIFFAVSIFYCFTLRLLVIRLYPSDTEKKDLDHELSNINKCVKVIEEIPATGSGRIELEGIGWIAKTLHNEKITTGEMVRIIKQENITFIVEKIKKDQEF